MKRLAVLGAGRRMCSMLRGFSELGVQIAAIADPQPDRVRERLRGYDVDDRAIRFVDSPDTLLESADDFDGFAIGTRCHLHTPLAVRVAATGKPLFLEKPVALTSEQQHVLAQAWAGREHQVVVSFPLRVTPIFRAVKEILRSGRLGVINQIQAVNNVQYGGVYFETWYRRFEEVGGLWLQKATHDFDYLCDLLDARPVRLSAMMTQRIFGTGHELSPGWSGVPDEAYRDRHDPSAPAERISDPTEALQDVGNPFHAAIRNQDAGSALVWFENGVIVSYDQNFVTRRSAGCRGATITGYNASLQWDWKSETIRVTEHHSGRVDQIACPAEGGHGGGDHVLQRAFLTVMNGGENTVGDLGAGLRSVAICLAARKAAQQFSVETIDPAGWAHRQAASSEQAPDPARIEA